MGNDTRNRPTTGRREFRAASSGRIDAVLAAAYPDLSRARLQRLIAGGNVSINGEAVRKSGQVQPGDELCLDVPETPHEAVPANFDIPVLFEDDWLIAVNKPPGLAVHGAPGDTSPGVALWMLQRLGSLAASFDVERPGIVHRLDRDTSGVLLLAKTPAAQASLSAQFEARTTRKTYVALTDGVPDRPRAVIDADIGRHPGDRTKMAIARHGRDARTAYVSLGDDGHCASLLLRPETGRTHQIRVHLAAIASPVLFDRVYGKGGDGRQMLHAWQLRIPHPAGGVLTVTAPIPPDFEAAVRAIGLEQLALPYLLAAPASLDDDMPGGNPDPEFNA